MNDADGRKQRFAEAFPWWAEGKAKHGWAMKVEYQPGVREIRRGGILMAVEHDPAKDNRSIQINMPGATKEQYDAIESWAIAEYERVLQLPPQEREQNKSDV
jgi:hypothetical protein